MTIRRHSPIYRALFAAIVFLAAAFTPAKSHAEIDPWAKAPTEYLINGPLRLNLGFTDQTGTPRVAIASSLSAAQLAGLPDGLVKAKDSVLVQPPGANGAYFEAMWNAINASVCKDVQNAITKLVNHSPNTAYDVTPCVMNPKGYLVASFQTSWPNPNNTLQTVTGKRIRLDYAVPLNGVVFWVTSPHTCHHGDNCPTEPQDPAFSIIFTANIAVVCTPFDPSSNTFALPVACTPDTSIDIEAVYGGDVTGQLTAAALAWSKQVVGEAGSIVASGGASAPEALAAFTIQAVNVAVKGLGAAIAAATDEHLRDQVSSWLIGYVSSATLNANATKASADFGALYQNLYTATLGGLKPFVVGISPELGLDFGLVYPVPAKPQLQNTTQATNQGSLFSPMIAVAQPEVEAGQTIPVTATYFRGAYVNALTIGWNKTVIGTPKTTVDWGPPQTMTDIGELLFQPANLKPATHYGFRVHECDGLTCAPWSEILATMTEAAGSNDVTFYLDADTAHSVGSGTVGAADASFVTKVTIPPTTTTGQHLLHASMPGQPLATAAIFVCQPGGCGASVAVVNVQNKTLYPPGSQVGVGNPVVLRGSRFAPGGTAAIFVDTIKGPKAGNAPVGPLGNFQASFTMPLVSPGPHRFLAVEAKPGPHPFTPVGKKPALPNPLQFVTANVAIYVQALAQ